MHCSSYRHMQQLVTRHLAHRSALRVADLGSQDVNGSYRPLFDCPGWTYVGVDLAPGKNVDVVLTTPYQLPFAHNSFDVVVSGQAFEHVEFFWLTWLELTRIIKPGGLILLIAPSRGPEHRYPVDCWRFYPDGFKALAKFASVRLIDVSTDWDPAPEPDSAPRGDTVGVFCKDLNMPLFKRIQESVARRLYRWAACLST